jgi:formylglycine-generating enzyme required for sulfatase activity
MVRAVVALIVLVLVSSAAQAQKRIALILTNQAYTQAGARLTNTHRDGDLVKAALERVGFRVWVVKDTANEGALLAAIGEHVARLAQAGPDAVGFFYYSGHGAADRPDGANYLIPTAAPLTHVAHLPLMAVRLDRITATLASAGKMSFVVFDACRNVPLQRDSKDLGHKGFAPVREQRGLLIAYATEPGSVAIDQSLYAQALADEIVRPGLEAGQVFRAVTRRVLRDTQDKQSPEYLDKRLNDFHFASAASIAVTPTPPPARCDGVEVAVGYERRCLKPGAGKTVWFKDCPTCPEMVIAPAGRFTMGSPKDEPERIDWEDQVSVAIAKPFAVGRFAVTRGEFAAFVSVTGHNADGGCSIYTGSAWKQPSDASWRSVGFAQTDQHPVVCVNWNDAKAYVAWLSKTTGKTYRLLSETEREYVARAGTTTPFWWGATISSGQANYNGTYYAGGGTKGEWRKATVPVDSFTANPWGLYNVQGNVWEWTEDCWNQRNAGNPGSGSARTSGECISRVRRGGSWVSSTDDLRSAARYMDLPVVRNFLVGFRVARTLD